MDCAGGRRGGRVTIASSEIRNRSLAAAGWGERPQDGGSGPEEKPKEEVPSVKGDGTWSYELLGLFLIFILVAFVLVCVAAAFTGDSIGKVYGTYDFVKDYCCRMGYELPNGEYPGGCTAAKQNFMDKLEGGKLHGGTTFLSVATASTACVGTLAGWIFCWTLFFIIVTAYMRSTAKKALTMTREDAEADPGITRKYPKYYRQRRDAFQVGVFIAFLVGTVAVILTSIQHTYVAVVDWDADYIASGCCCCWNPTTQKCNSDATMCNGTNPSGAGCLNHNQLLALEGPGYANIVDEVMPQPWDTDSWSTDTLTVFTLTVISWVFFMVCQIVAIYFNKPDATITLQTSNKEEPLKMVLDKTDHQSYAGRVRERLGKWVTRDTSAQFNYNPVEGAGTSLSF